MFGRKYSNFCYLCRKEYSFKKKKELLDFRYKTDRRCPECGGFLGGIPPCPVKIQTPPVKPPKDLKSFNHNEIQKMIDNYRSKYFDEPICKGETIFPWPWIEDIIDILEVINNRIDKTEV